MKRLLILALCVLPAGATLAQALADSDNPPVNVTLVAAPANAANVGGSVTLTATVTPRKPMKAFSVAKERLRYNFKALRTWPCPEDVTIAQGSSNNVVTWNSPKTGDYKITVDAYYPSKLGASTVGRQEIAGSASINEYAVRPASPSGIVSPGQMPPPNPIAGDIKLSYSPPSGSTVVFPVSVAVTARIDPAPDPALFKFRFKFYCHGPCNPVASNFLPGLPSSATWNTTVVSAFGASNALNGFSVYVDKVWLPNCTVESKFGSDLSYRLTAQAQ